MKIDSELKKHFKAVENKFFEMADPHLNGFDRSVNVVEVPEFNIDGVEDLRLKRVPSFSMDITLSSIAASKKIEFNIHDGVNIANTHFNALNFSMALIDNPKSNWFGLQDYFTHNNIDDEIDDFFAVDNFDQALKKANHFLEQVVFLLEQEDIKHILSSKDWLDVPHDKSMYF